MRAKSLLALSLMLSLGAIGVGDVPAADTPKTELEKFTGTWLAQSVTHDGKELPPAEVKKILLSVDGPRYTLVMGTTIVKGTHKLNPDKKPKAIDAMRTTGDGKGATIKGIYELDDTSFKVCFSAAGKDRPTEFTATAGTGNRLLTFKRSKRKR